MLRSPSLDACARGHFGDPRRECRCSRRQVEQYRNRISGPLLDRIDIPVVEFQQLRQRPGKPQHYSKGALCLITPIYDSNRLSQRAPLRKPLATTEHP